MRTLHLTGRFVRRSDVAPTRIAVVVGRRVSRRAVDRHRVARWLRAALQPHLAALRPGLDLTLTATAPFAAYSSPRCREEVARLLAQAHLLAP